MKRIIHWHPQYSQGRRHATVHIENQCALKVSEIETLVGIVKNSFPDAKSSEISFFLINKPGYKEPFLNVVYRTIIKENLYEGWKPLYAAGNEIPMHE
jgi:hypothetical protein